MAFNHAGSPIRISPDHFLFANPRSFSQLTTSFITSGSQGIPRSLLGSGVAGTGTGSGLTEEEYVSEDVYGDDAAAVNNSLFKNMYKAPTHKRGGGRGRNGNGAGDQRGGGSGDGESEDEDATLTQIPAGIKYASTMSELQKVASETNFSDDEGSAGGEGEDHSSDEDDSAQKAKKNDPRTDRGQKASATKSPSGRGVTPPPPPPPVGRRPSLLMQASTLIFGGKGNHAQHEGGGSEEDESSGEDSDSSGDNLKIPKNKKSNARKHKGGGNNSSDEDE